MTSDDQALELLRAQAKPLIEAQLIDKWVPQIGSYGVNGDMSDKDILSSQRTQQSQFHALLLITDDYTTATPGYWVSVAPLPSESAEGALAWCGGQNLDRDHCFARFITHDPAVTDIRRRGACHQRQGLPSPRSLPAGQRPGACPERRHFRWRRLQGMASSGS